MSQNRYPGVRPFEFDQQALFFGRDADIQRLFELILLEKLVLLFGKSGYGKTSLLMAGVLPRFLEARQQDAGLAQPVFVRFGSYSEKTRQIHPLEKVRLKLNTLHPELKENRYLEKLPLKSTLWEAFKKRQTERKSRFLLVFDQFEEFFSYPAEQQADFKTQLAELLYCKVPQYMRNAADDLQDEDFDRLIREMEVKAVFAIRSDRLSYVDQICDALPAILSKRYELLPLQPDQARLAIEKPASLKGEEFSFDSPPFSYSPEALDLILEALKSKEAGQTGIEAFQLQIICQHLEQLAKEGRIKEMDEEGNLLIKKEDLPELGNIYEAYYRHKIGQLSEKDQKAARVMIEEGLISVNPDTDETRRLSVDGQALIDRFHEAGVDQYLLNTLVNSFLLRQEPNTTGGYNFEISHDTLLKPIEKARRESRATEAAQRQEEARKEAEARAREERERREEAEELKNVAVINERKARANTRIARIVALVAGGLAIFAGIQYAIAELAQTEAQERFEALQSFHATQDSIMVEDLMARAIVLESLAKTDSFYEKPKCELYGKAAEIVGKHEDQSIFGGQEINVMKKWKECQQ